MIMRRAIRKNNSGHADDWTYISLGVFEMTDEYRKSGFTYEQAAEHWRRKAQRQYGRQVKAFNETHARELLK